MEPTQLWKPSRVSSGLAMVVITAVLLAGCGGTQDLSHRALVTQADTACRTADAAVSKLGVPTTSLHGLNQYAGRVLPISRKLAHQLAALKAGSADATKLHQLVSAVQNGNQGLILMAKATSTAQTNRAGQLITATSVPHAANALGAAGCASSPSA